MKTICFHRAPLTVLVAWTLLLMNPLHADESTDWRYFGGTTAGFQQYSDLSQIDRDSVADLGIEWIWKSPDAAIDAEGLKDPSGRQVVSFAFRSTPLVVDGTLYVRTAYSMVAAVDPETGATLWQFDPKAYERDIPANFGHTAWGLAYCGDGKNDRLFLLTGDGRLFALGLKGDELQEFGDNGHVDVADLVEMPDLSKAPPQSLAFYTPPLVCGDTVIVAFAEGRARPVFSKTYGTLVPNWPRGDVHGFDVRTGAQKWTFHTVPREGEFGADTWSGPDAHLHAGKANVWASMSCDEENGLAYLPVSGPSENFLGIHRQGNNLFSQSVVAVEAETGQRRWHYQTIHHGLWDYDLVAAPTLMDITVAGKPIKALVQINKSGLLFVLDRLTGKPVWPIEEREVPPSVIPGEFASPTQPFPTRPAPVDVQAPLNESNLVDLTPKLAEDARAFAATLGGNALFTPSGPKNVLFLPGVGGGPNWGGASFDPELQYLFVPSRTNPNLFSIEPIDPKDPAYARSLLGVKRTVSLNRWLPNNFPVTRPPYSRITAIDMTTGEHVWVAANGHGYDTHPALGGKDFGALGSSGLSGILTTKTLVFSADNGAPGDVRNQKPLPGIRAFDKRTGNRVWEAPLPYAYSGAMPITYLAGGKQYIVLALGGDPKASEWAPGYLVAYAIGGNRAVFGERSSEPAQAGEGQSSAAERSAQTTSTSGADIFDREGCEGCHGKDGTPLVALDLYSDEELAELIRRFPSEMMPHFDIDDEDMARLIRFLRERAR